MAKDVRPVHHADRRHDVTMPYAPALLVRRGSLLFLSGVTAAPVYHSHPHREEEFDLPRGMREQARLAIHANCKIEISAIAVAEPPATPTARRSTKRRSRASRHPKRTR